MSKVIEERVTEMRFENGLFEKAVNQSLQTIAKLKEALNFQNVGKGLESLSIPSESIKNNLGSAVDNVRERFGALDIAAGVALGNIASSAISAGTSLIKSMTLDPIIDGFNEYETQLNAVQTILANTQSKGSTLDDVNAALNELNKYADLTIYNFTEMTRNIGTFTAAGVDLDTSVNAIKGIANLAAVSGSNSQQASTAMYQLSQALAAGKVQLQDWNSVVNAGMGGELFQNALIRTARIMGTGVDEALEKYGNFRESLTKGAWLTSEVLTETLKQISGAYSEADLIAQGFSAEQAAEIAQLAQTATDAATKVKTFTQLMDTVKEAIGSGWAQTWQIIIGDFEEAKELWTSISDVLTGFIGKMSDARNNMLQAWKDAGGRTALLNSFKNILTGIYNLIKPFTDAFKAMIPKVTGEQLAALCKGFEKLTSFFRVSETTSQNLSKVLVALVSPFKLVNFAIGEMIKLLVTVVTVVSKPIITLFQSIVVSLIKFSASIVDFLTNIGNAIKSTNIYIKAFDILTNSIKPVIDTMVNYISKAYNKLTDALYSIRNIGKDDILSFINFIKVQLEPLSFIVDYIKAGIDKIVEVMGPYQEKLKSSFDGLKSIIQNANGDTIYIALLTFAEALHSNLTKFVEYLKGVGSVLQGKSIFTIISEYFSNNFGPQIEATSDYVSRAMIILSNAFSKIKDVSIEKFQQLVDRFKEASDKLASIGPAINKGIQSLVSTLQSAKDSLTKTSLGFKDAIDTTAKSIDPDKFLQFVGGGALIGLLWKLKSMYDDFMDLLKGKEFKNSFIGVMDSMSGTLEAYQSNLKADKLVKIALAIGILAGALLLISQVESDKLESSVFAMAAVMGELAAMLALFNKIGDDKGIISSTKTVLVLIGISAALLMLSDVFLKLSGIDWDGISKGLIAIVVMCASLVLSANAISKEAGMMRKAAFGLITFATALRAMVKVVEGLGSLDTDVLTKGLIGVAVMCAELALFMKAADLSGMGLKSGVGLVLFASSLFILASAVKKFSELNFGALTKGLLSVVVFANAIKAIPGITSTAIGLTILGVALLGLAFAIKMLAKLDFPTVAEGLGYIAAGLTVISSAMRLMPESALTKALAMAIVIAQLSTMGRAISKLGSMDLVTMSKGLLAMAGALTIISLATNSMTNSIGGAFSLLIISTSLGILAGVLEKFGSLPLSVIGAGLLALAGIFVILGVAGTVLSPVVPTLLGLSGAIALLGVGALALGGGLLLLSVGLTTLAASGVAGFTALATGLKMIIALLPGLAKSLGEAFIEFAKVISDNMPIITELFVSLLKGLITAMIATIPMVVEGIFVLINEILDTLNKHLPHFIEAGCDMLISLLEGIASKMDDIVAAAIDVVIAFIKGIDSRIEDVVDAGLDLIGHFFQALIEGIGRNVGNVIVSIGTAMGDIVTAGKDAALGFIGDYIKAGSDLISGLIDGIWSGLSGVVDAISNVASKAIEKGKEVLDIHSPSRVFKQMGRYCDEGLALGLLKYSNVVEDATEDVGSDTIDAMKKILSEIDFDDPDGGPIIRPVLDLSQVTSGVNDIDRLFKDTNTSLSLTGGITDANITALKNSKIGIQNDNSDVVSAINKLNKTIEDSQTGDSYSINGITYDDGSNISNAVQTLVRAAKVGRRI